MTEQEIETYFQSLEPGSMDLIVRISRFPDKVSPIKDRPREAYPVTANFDQAVNPETGELIIAGRNSVLKWFVRPGFLKDPFGYRMKKGHIYRLRLRRKAVGTERYEYYVDALLASDVDEPKLDPLAQFYGEYDTEVKECVFLNKKKLYGWGLYWDYPRYSVQAVAWIMDPVNGSMDTRGGILTYLDALKKNGRKLNFEPMRVYRAQVRKSLTKDNVYLLVRMPEEVKDPRFDAVIEDYMKPREITNEFGTFKLNREYDWYSGTMELGGKECVVTLETSDDGIDASLAEAAFKKLLADPDEFIQRAKTYTADAMSDLVEDWNDEPITKDEFMSRIGMPDITASSDGSVSLFFNDDDMFAGHVIVVEIDAEGNFTEATIAG